jgi:hypothetical protein
MGELTTDSTPGGSTPAAAPTAAGVAHAPATTRSEAPSASRSLSATGTGGRRHPRVRDWSGSSVARDDIPSVVEQRNDLARFGVAILDFKHPAPEDAATWEQRFGRLFETLQAGEVVMAERALGQSSDEVARTIRTLRRHNLVVKVLSQGVPQMKDAGG